MIANLSTFLFLLFPPASTFLLHYGSKTNFIPVNTAKHCPWIRGEVFPVRLKEDLVNRQITICVHQKEETLEDAEVSMQLPSAIAIRSGVTDPSNQSKSALEFFAMMDEFSQFTERDIGSVQNPRLRALFEGVQAGGKGKNAREIVLLFVFVLTLQTNLCRYVLGNFSRDHHSRSCFCKIPVSFGHLKFCMKTSLLCAWQGG